MFGLFDLQSEREETFNCSHSSPFVATDHNITIYYPTSTCRTKIALRYVWNGVSAGRFVGTHISLHILYILCNFLYIYKAAGGGCKKLFRKIGNRSSEFYPDVNEVRRNGSYIYEEFVETQGTDVKMYTYVPAFRSFFYIQTKETTVVHERTTVNSPACTLCFCVSFLIPIFVVL